MALVPKEVRDAVQKRLDDVAYKLEALKQERNHFKNYIAGKDAEIADAEKRADELADWLRNNQSST